MLRWIQVHIHLGKRNMDPLGIKGKLDALLHVEKKGPVIRRFTPGLYGNSDGAVLMGAYSDKRGRVGQHQRMLVTDFL